MIFVVLNMNGVIKIEEMDMILKWVLIRLLGRLRLVFPRSKLLKTHTPHAQAFWEETGFNRCSDDRQGD